MKAQSEYYGDPHVRAAMRAYCGATDGGASTAVFVAGLEPDNRPFPTWGTHGRTMPPSGLESLWAAGRDIARSLWDREHLLFLIELDYQNIDREAEPYVRPVETFFKLEAAFGAARRVFTRLGMEPAAVVTGRGYQFTGVVRLDAAVVDQLAALAGGPPPWLSSVPDRLPPGVTASMNPRHAAAAEGLGRLVEFTAHLILREVSDSPIPVVVNGTVVGTGLAGRECVSIDFSHVGDPLDVRHCRMAFSTYQWHRLRPDIFGAAAAGLAPLAAVPRDTRTLFAVLSEGRDLDAGIRATRFGTAIPDVTHGVAALFRLYEDSALAAWHREFHDYPRPMRLRPLESDRLPPCVTRPLLAPNDLLLRPHHLQHVVRGLMAHGWHPGDIAELVRAKYEEDHGWGDRWTHMHAGTRAHFEVRVFAGLFRAGLDALVDFNCVSAQEKDVCPRTGCAYDLLRDGARLEAMRAL